MRNVTLVLNNGFKLQGKSFGYEKSVTGEVVFNSAMTGYPEALTDPTFAGQIMVMTYRWQLRCSLNGREDKRPCRFL